MKKYISENTAENILKLALSKGGNFAEIFLENKVQNSISLVNGNVEKSMSGIDYGLGLRVFNGLGAVYAYTNDMSEENLFRVAKEVADSINLKQLDTLVLNFNKFEPEIIHNIKIMPGEVSKKSIVDILKESSESAFNYNKLITETSCSYLDQVQDVLIANSDGLWVEDRRVRTRMFISAVATKGNEKQTGGFSPGASKGFELFNNIDVKQLGKESARKAVTMLNADLCPSGKMPVIIDRGFGGVIFHEACGHSLEATSVAKGASEFADKKGKQIASSIVTAVDDGTIQNAWGSQHYDDEGTKMQKNILIKDGILNSFLVDKLNGLKMGEKSTGSSRRQSYKYAPTSRMTNTYIEAGTDKEEDIIKDTEFGIYAKTMGGGSVQPATGEFNFAVTEAYMVRNGKIEEPVRGATLIGKGSEILMNIDRVSENVEYGQGMCGSASGSVPTNCGQPMIRVSEILVGGRK